jgi:hypothetical protein
MPIAARADAPGGFFFVSRGARPAGLAAFEEAQHV